MPVSVHSCCVLKHSISDLEATFSFFSCCIYWCVSVGVYVPLWFRGQLFEGWFSSPTLFVRQGLYCFCSCVGEFSISISYFTVGFCHWDCRLDPWRPIYFTCVLGVNSRGQSCVAKMTYPLTHLFSPWHTLISFSFIHS